MRSRAVLLMIGALLVVCGGGGWSWWRSRQEAEILSAAIPSQPDLSQWPEPMRRRVADVQGRLAQDPRAGLGELGRLYHANGFYAEALQCYGALEQLEPRQARWFHLHATILAGYGDSDAALPLWERTVELVPDYLPARLRLGDVQLKRNDLERARAIYSAIFAEHPSEAYARLGLARCEFEEAHWEQARRLLEPLVAQTGYVLGYDMIVTVYEKLGMEDRARAVRGLQRASGAYRDAPDPWADELLDGCFDVYRLSLASAEAARNGDTALALRRLEQALALAPGQATLHFQLGMLRLRTQSYSKARESLEHCTVLQPEFADGWAQLALLHETLGNREVSDRAVAQGLRHCPGSPGLHLQDAKRLVRERQYEAAIPVFREAIRLRTNEADAYLGLAQVLFQLDRTDEGLAEVDCALVVEPGHPLALSIRAFDAIMRGQELAARQWIGRVEAQPRTRKEETQRLLAAFRQRFGREYP